MGDAIGMTHSWNTAEIPHANWGCDSLRQSLVAFLLENEDVIIDYGTNWVFHTAIDLGRAGREIGFTRRLVEHVVNCNIEWLRSGSLEPTEAFIEFVTTIRAEKRFHISTLLRGFLSCRRAVEKLFESSDMEVAEKFVCLELLDYWYHQSIFNVGDRFNDKLRDILLRQQEQIREHEKERHLREAEAARAANEAKSAFLANVSHELRTPLTAILGYGQLLGQSEIFQGEEREMLETIQKSGQHLMSVINSVLDMSKIEAGHLDWDEEPVELNRLVKTAFQMLKCQAEEKGLRYDIQLSTGHPTWVKADAPKLRQIFINLLGNAVKFTKNGSVEVEFECGPGSEADFHRMRFVVRDTGPGIAPEYHDRIFCPFEQAEHGRGSGTGLGLPISQRILQSLGSQLILDSELGSGATFSFELVLPGSLPPIFHDETVIEDVTPEHSSRRGRVLVVDDEPRNRTLMGRMLREVECDICYAADAREARKVASEEVPDLILMDKRLPDCDGFELATELYGQLNNPKLRIITITADVFNMQKAQELCPYINGILHKPFDLDELRSRVRSELAIACGAD